MAWETRARSGRYYTRSRKVGGRVVREYVGAGLAGELAALEDAEARDAREASRADLVAEQHRFAAAVVATQALCALAEAAAVDALEAAGYHRHDRGEWRRRRGAA